MKALFDQGVPVPLRTVLGNLDITTAYQMGWSKLTNGDLLAAAEKAGFTVFITTDKNLAYQQDLRTRIISIVVLPTTRWPEIKLHGTKVEAAILSASVGSYCEVTW